MVASWEDETVIDLTTCYRWIREPRNRKTFADKIERFPEIHIDIRLDYLLYTQMHVHVPEKIIGTALVQKLISHAIYYGHNQLLDTCLYQYPYMCNQIMYSLFKHIALTRSYTVFEHILKHYRHYVFYDLDIAIMLYLEDVRLFATYMNAVHRRPDEKKSIITSIHQTYFLKHKVRIENISKIKSI